MKLASPTPDEVEHCRQAELRRALDAAREVEAALEADIRDGIEVQIELELDTEAYDFHPTWWFTRRGCVDGDEGCGCGPVTLLEVLTRASEDNHMAVIAAHMNVMRQLYDHFWSGQGIISGSSERVLDACAGCLTNGPQHVWGVFDAAREMAQDLGEALAAHESVVSIGPLRDFAAHFRD